MSLRSVGWVLAGSVALGLACSAPAAPTLQREAAEARHEIENEHEHEHEALPPAGGTGLVRVEPQHVCMLSNRFLGEKPNVPVEVEGKTYFGCCANCAARIGSHAEARLAVDPISGRSIEKASAVLARDETNKVLYFESEATLAQMQAARK